VFILLIAAYLAVGVALLCMPKVRIVVWSPVIRTDWHGQPAWKRPVFITVILTGAVIGWPIFLRSWLSFREQMTAHLHANMARRD